MIETHGSLQTQVLQGESSFPYRQLVSQQVDLKREFFMAMRVCISYREQILIFQYKGICASNKLTSLPGAKPRAPTDGRVNKLTLPARTER
jgi:hypothetical protein